MFGKQATKAVSGLLALALAVTMCPAAGLAFATGDGSQRSTTTDTNANAGHVNQDVALDSSGNAAVGAGSTAGAGASTPESGAGAGIGAGAGAGDTGSKGSATENAGATDGETATAIKGGSTKYTSSVSGQTSADVSLNGTSTVGTIEYSGLAYTINENDSTTVSVTGLASTKPSGDVQIPKQIASGGSLYTVTGIEALGMPEGANPYATDLFDSKDKASAVKTVNIPASVKSVNPALFQLFPNATDITVAPENETYTSYDGALYNADATQLILVPQGKGSLVLPTTLATVPAYVFSQCDKLSATSFPGGTSNDFLAVANNILYTNDYTTLLAAPAGLGASATIAPECTTIAEGAFYGNAALETIVVNGVIEGIAKAGDVAEGAEGETLLSGSSIDNSTLPAFNDNTVADSTVVLNLTGDFLEDVAGRSSVASESSEGTADGDEYAALLERAKSAWLDYGFQNFKEPAAPGTEIKPTEGSGFAFTLLPDYTLSVRWAGPTEPPAAIDIPDYGVIDGVQYTVSTIAEEGFSNYTSLITVEVPQTVTAIGDSAFALCTNLQTIRFDAVTTIGELAFSNAGLLSLVLPSTVQSIADNAFSNMKETTIVALGSVADNSPIALGAATGLDIYVPLGTEDNWDAGIPAYGNHIYPYGVQLAQESLELEVGQIANIAEGGYIEAPGDIETNYAYKANSISLDTETGEIEAKVAGSFSLEAKLSISIDEIVVSRNINNVKKLEQAHFGVLDPEYAFANEGDTVQSRNIVLDVNGIAGVVKGPDDSSEAEILNAHQDNEIQTQIFRMANVDSSLVTTAETTTRTLIQYTPIAGTNTCEASLTEDGKKYGGTILVPSTVTIGSSEYAVAKIADDGFKFSKFTGLELPEGLVEIGASAFDGCTNLTSISLPTTLKVIGQNSFWSTGITYFYIPKSVETIGGFAFGGWGDLERIEVDPQNPAFADLDGVLFDKDMTTLKVYPRARAAASYSVPSGVSAIERWAFSCNSRLQTLSLPASVTSIGAAAFESSSALRDLYVYGKPALGGANVLSAALKDILTVHCYRGEDTKAGGWESLAYKPAAYVYISEDAEQTMLRFERIGETDACEASLTDVGKQFGGTIIVPGTATVDGVQCRVSAIAEEGFRSGSLSGVELPEGLEDIGDSAFDNCPRLNAVSLPSTLKSIGSNAFYSAAAESFYIPASVESMGPYAFGGRTLKAVDVDPANDSFASQDGVLFDKAMTTLKVYPSNREGESYLVPGGVASIEAWAFAYSENLRSVTLPESVGFIGARSFSGASALTDLYVYGKPSLGAEPLDVISQNVTVHCHSGEDTKAGGWESLASKPEAYVYFDDATDAYLHFDRIGSTATCEVSLTEEGLACTGAIVVPQKAMVDGVECDVVRVKKKGFFQGRLSGVGLPEGLTAIGEAAFDNCNQMSSISMPSTLTTIETDAFWSVGIDYFYIPKTVTTLGNNVFGGYSPLEKIEVDPGNPNYTSRDGVLFDKGMTRLIVYPKNRAGSSYSIPSGVTDVSQWSFCRAEYLEKVTLPESVASIGTRSFSGASALTDLYVYGKPSLGTEPLDVIGQNVTVHCHRGEDTKAGGWESLSVKPKAYVYLDAWEILIEFSNNGKPNATNMPASQPISENAAIYKPADPSLEHYTFGGWYEEPACQTAVDFNVGVTGQEFSKTFYAKWVPIPYPITVDNNGVDVSTGAAIDEAASAVTPGDNPDTYTFEQAVRIENPTRVGYTFVGWDILVDVETGSITSANDSKTVVINAGSAGAVSLQAKWRVNTYSISFAAGDGATGSAAAMEMVYGTAQPLPDSTGFAKPGYEFAGWSYSGDIYQPGDNVSFVVDDGANVEMVAAWEEITYTATFRKNNTPNGVAWASAIFDTDGKATAVGRYTGDYKVALPVPSAVTGYTFNGWFANDDGTGTQFTADASGNIVLSEDIEMFACWAVNMHDVSITPGAGIASAAYAPEGGAATSSTADVAYGTKVVLSATLQAGYNSLVWNVEQGGSDIPVQTDADGSTRFFTMPDGDASITCSATAGDVPYKVAHMQEKLDGSGYDTVETENLTTKADALSVTPAAKSYTGFAAPSIAPQTVDVNGSTVIEIKYARNSYTVTFDANGGAFGEGAGAVATKEKTLKFGALLADNLISDVPKRGGHRFAGWFTAGAGDDPTTGGVQVSAETVPANNDTVLYAYWNQILTAESPIRALSFSMDQGAAFVAANSGKDFTVESAETAADPSAASFRTSPVSVADVDVISVKADAGDDLGNIFQSASSADLEINMQTAQDATGAFSSVKIGSESDLAYTIVAGEAGLPVRFFMTVPKELIQEQGAGAINWGASASSAAKLSFTYRISTRDGVEWA